MKQTRLVILLISLLLFSALSYAQNSFRLDSQKTSLIDNSLIECLYQYTNIVQTKEPKEGEDEYQPEIYNTILQANTSVSKFWDYNAYKKDSINYASLEALSSDSIFKLFAQYNMRVKYLFIPVVIKNYPAGKTSVTDEIIHFDYIYEEENPAIDWELGDDISIVCGYPCNNAKASYRGKEWMVWYTPEITISDGPWKLCGLPGLILKAEDDSGTHIFEAISIRQAENPIYLDKNIKQVKIKRDEFIRNKNSFTANPEKAFQDARNTMGDDIVFLKNEDKFIINNKILRINFDVVNYSPLEFE